MEFVTRFKYMCTVKCVYTLICWIVTARTVCGARDWPGPWILSSEDHVTRVFNNTVPGKYFRTGDQRREISLHRKFMRTVWILRSVYVIAKTDNNLSIRKNSQVHRSLSALKKEIMF